MSTSHFSLPIVFQIVPNTFLHKLHSCRNVCRHGAGDTLRLGRLSLGMSRYVSVCLALAVTGLGKAALVSNGTTSGDHAAVCAGEPQAYQRHTNDT